MNKSKIIIKAPGKIDLTEFKKDKSNVTKYGLPKEVKFCKKCVISNQRPNTTVEFKHTEDSKKTTINFNEDGVCDACIVTEKKNKNIDWEKRERELKDLCEKYRSQNGSYDCLVPGSGGKDSFYASHILKYKYNMNPLTVTWAPNIYTQWGWENFQAWIHSGLDNYLMTPNGKTHRLLTRLAVDKLFHPFQPFILGQKCFAPKMAIKFNIPLIFYGEQEAEYGTPVNEAMSSKRDWTFSALSERDNMFFGGVSYESLKNDFGLTDNDLSIYIPESIKDIEKTSIDFRYLGYYLKWHPQSNYYYAAEHSDFKAAPERTVGTYSKYNSIDDKIDDLHYYTTRIKFGLGRTSYDASQEIRNNHITREEGMALVDKFDHEFPDKYFSEIMDYIGLTGEDFMNICDKFRPPHLWKKVGNDWKLRHTVNKNGTDD